MHQVYFIFLVCSGADIERKTANHFTPLHAAIRYTQPGPVHLLLKRGADVTSKDGQRSYNAVLWAVEMQNCKILEVSCIDSNYFSQTGS